MLLMSLRIILSFSHWGSSGALEASQILREEALLSLSVILQHAVAP